MANLRDRHERVVGVADHAYHLAVGSSRAGRTWEADGLERTQAHTGELVSQVVGTGLHQCHGQGGLAGLGQTGDDGDGSVGVTDGAGVQHQEAGGAGSEVVDDTGS